MIKCPKCGNPGDGFHICVDLSYRAPGEGKIIAPNKGTYQMSAEHRANLSIAQKARHARNRGIDSLG